MPKRNTSDNSAAKAIVADALFDRLHPEIGEWLLTLASLKYPIHDRQSLKKQLAAMESAADPKWPTGRRQLIERAFRASDFGLDTPTGAIEKFAARIPIDPPPPDIPEAPEGREEESPPDVTFPEFEPEPIPPFFGEGPCGSAAQGLFRRLLRRRVPFNQALSTAQALEARCNATMPETNDIFGCGRRSRRIYANCLAAGGSVTQCRARFEAARQQCLYLYRSVQDQHDIPDVPLQFDPGPIDV